MNRKRQPHSAKPHSPTLLTITAVQYTTATSALATRPVKQQWNVAALRSCRIVIGKTLARRLERLEDVTLPPEEDVLVIQIVLVNSEGERVCDGLE